VRVVLGVGGGIAAYKAASLLRLFTEAGHDVTVIPTDAATRFVGTATWEALSGKPVSNSVWDDVDKVNHVRLGHEADLIVIAPATADVLARAAAGLANDLLTGTLLMARAPVVMAPAMHTEMWQHAATRANVDTLRGRGITVIEPASGRLTGSDSGPGRLPEPADIFAAALAVCTGAAGQAQDLQGRRVTISAGGTREALDPVRFLGNRSSGKQGMALAEAALARGASVTLVLAHAEVPPPPGCDVVRVESALELRDAVLGSLPDTDILVMAAAVADFRPAEFVTTKIKKNDDGTDPVITLVRNPDVLREAVLARGGRDRLVIAGFAAETGDATADPLTHARAKLARKGCDLLVLNVVGAGLVFGEDTNEVIILDAAGHQSAAVRGSKRDVADAVIERAAALLPR
jgi:phosphopantothenoylcysteine decarboxylase/phosphopantothenate--cysteine ligase